MAWQSDNAPCDNLYVKGLPEEFDGDAVTQFFSACGTVVRAKSMGKGVAMVQFSSEEEATMVKEAMNGQQPMGCDQAITISFATTSAGGGADWNCPACGDLQFAKNTQCRMCGSAKEGGGFGKAAGKGGCKAGPYGGGKAGGKAYKKSKLCNNFEQGFCPRGDACTFAHGEHELGTNQPGQGGGGAGGGQFFPANKQVHPCAAQGISWQTTDNASTIKGLVDGLIKEGLPGATLPKDHNALYVTNLPVDTTDVDLYVIFGTFGALPPRATKIMPTSQGSRCHGFVNFMESANADFALTCLNGVTQPDGAKLYVRHKTKSGESAPAPQGFVPHPVSGAAPGVTPAMMARLQKKLATGMMSANDICQWYIVEYLGHVEDEGVMKNTCDMLLIACGHLGLA